MRKMRKFFEKIRQNQGIALALSALLGWPVFWLGVLLGCILFIIVSGWIVSIL
jgi:Mn2+/Fe2+ NRAMP family transporter